MQHTPINATLLQFAVTDNNHSKPHCNVTRSNWTLVGHWCLLNFCNERIFIFVWVNISTHIYLCEIRVSAWNLLETVSMSDLDNTAQNDLQMSGRALCYAMCWEACRHICNFSAQHSNTMFSILLLLYQVFVLYELNIPLNFFNLNFLTIVYPTIGSLD